MLRKILIADDEKINRKLLKEILCTKFDILEAENGQEAYSIMIDKNNIISAVFLDINMPDMSGFEILERRKDSTELSQIPVIVATVSDDDQTKVSAIRAGADDYIVKPYTPEIILNCLKNCIEKYENASYLNQLRYDTLTGIYRRETFIEIAADMINNRQAGYYILSRFDIANFKIINDQYGTDMGDRVLQYVASTIKSYIDTIDGICCRITADDFAILYPAEYSDTDEINKNHNETMAPTCISRNIHIRIGRYLVNDLSLSVSAMFDRAAMAAESIKGTYDTYISLYDDSLRLNLIHEQQIVNDMYEALKMEQFEPWFQPQYNHATGAMIGAEALVRWKRNGKYISPAEFVPIFERNGFIYRMDQYIWEQTCKHMRRWIDEGRNPLPVSVNISRCDAFHKHFVQVLTDIVNKYDLPYDLIRLEITESAFAESTKQIISKVVELIKLGFTVEIDDFGSGYSSLNTLKDVPASILKLDMKFFENTINTQRSGNIIESVVRMAKWLGMAVIAEGVEEREQADYLKSIGCYYIQGYYYARPMPVSKYEILLNGSNRESKLTRLKTLNSLDNNEFWNPKSMETLIFNSYVGGACIFEYNNGKIEILRVNEQYANELGYISGINVLSTDERTLQKLDNENRKKLNEHIHRAINGNRESACEIRIPNDVDAKYIRMTFRVIAKSGERYLFYCVVLNITAEKETNEQLRFLNDSAHDILSQPDSDKAIDQILEKLLDFFCGDRAYVIENDNVNQVCSNTYEICSEGVRSEKETVQNIPFSIAGVLLDRIREKQYIIVENVDKMDDSEASFRDFLLIQNVKSIVMASLCRDGVLIGYIGIDNPRSSMNQFSRLVALGDYIAILLTRRDLNKKILHDNEAMQTLINDTPGGFCRVAIHSYSDPTVVCVNDGFCRVLKMTEEELMNFCRDNVYKLVDPEDIPVLKSDFANAYFNDGQYTTRCRLCCKDGEKIPVIVFGRYIKEDNGEIFLNTYFTDITGQQEAEIQARKMLDSLPCGAALFDYDGINFSVIHINKKYWEFVGREHIQNKYPDVLGAIHPDDVNIIVKEINEAIKHKRNAFSIIRIICSDSVYRTFNISANITPLTNGRFTICATFTSVSNHPMSMQKMLALTLSTMLSVSEEMSFVKDKNLKYVCCSKSICNFLGIENEINIKGKTDYDLFEHEYAEKYSTDDKKLLNKEELSISCVEALTDINGKRLSLKTTKYPLMDAIGNVIGIYGISFDITAQKERESQHELLISSIPGGLAAFSLDKEKIELIYFNDGFYKYSGYERDEYLKMLSVDPFVLVFAEDRPKLYEILKKIRVERGSEEIYSCILRCHTRDGGYRWFNLKSKLSWINEEQAVLNAVQIDITDLKEKENNLHISEEEYRIAARHSGRTICRYNLTDRSLTMSAETAKWLGLTEVIKDVPYGLVKRGEVSKDTSTGYIEFYEKILRGEKEGTVTFEKLLNNQWHWVRAHFTTIFTDDGVPTSAVVSYIDVTDQTKKEEIYDKWIQSLDSRDQGSYSLFRCDLSRDSGFDASDGTLIKFDYSDTECNFDEYTLKYAEQRVYEEDRAKYIASLAHDKLIADFYNEKRRFSMDYREIVSDDSVRWIRRSTELVYNPNSHKIMAYLMFENIDTVKKEEIITLERSNTDSLTGVLNRSAFEYQVINIIKNSGSEKKHVLMMLDVDEFKQVNDTFGHDAGDHVLIEITEQIRNVLRSCDLFGRLGGDEFLIFFMNIPDMDVTARIAKRIGSIARKEINDDVAVSISIGVSTFPDDGENFETLYKKADKALYYVKKNGKDHFAFYCDEFG